MWLHYILMDLNNTAIESKFLQVFELEMTLILMFIILQSENTWLILECLHWTYTPRVKNGNFEAHLMARH